MIYKRTGGVQYLAEPVATTAGYTMQAEGHSVLLISRIISIIN